MGLTLATKRWVIVGSLALAVGLGVFLLTGSDDSSPERSSTTRTTQTTRSTRPATTTTQAPVTTTTTQAPNPGFPQPEDAIRDYVVDHGNEYAGDCSGTNLDTDVGKWCSLLGQDNGVTRTYGIGPAFAEFAEELTLENGAGGWVVTGSGPVPGIP